MFAQPDEVLFCADLSSFLFCRAKKPGIQLPKYHYIDHRIEILEQKDNYNQVVLYEKAAARYSPFPVKAAKWIKGLKGEQEKSLSVFKACARNKFCYFAVKNSFLDF